jgi:hypothetical protein
VAPLDQAQTAWLVERWMGGMKAAGVAIDGARPDGALTAGGWSYYLDNLAASLAQLPLEQWSQAVDRAVNQTVAPGVAPEADGEELLAALYPRVLMEASLGEEILAFFEPYAPPLGPGLVQVAAIDTPERVETLFAGDRLAPLGGWTAIYPRLLANLRALGRPQEAILRPESGNGAQSIHLWESDPDDFFGATRILLLDELLAEAGDPPGPLGAVVAIPARTHLLAHVLRDRASLITCLNGLAALTQQIFHDEPGSLSPFVYYRPSPGAPLQQLTVPGEDGQLRVEVRGAFADALGALR